MASSLQERHQPASDETLLSPSAEEGVHFNGLFRNKWDTWARTGRLDYKGLRAALPDVVKGLRDGTIDPEEFAECLTWQEMMLARERMESVPCIMDESRTEFNKILFLTVIQRWLLPDFRTAPEKMDSPVFAKFFQDMHQEMVLVSSGNMDAESFSRYKPGYLSWNVTDPNDFRETLYYAAWLYSLHRAWAKNKTAFEELIGQSLDQIPMLREGTSKREFDRTIDEVFFAYVDRKSSEFKAFYQKVKLVQLKREHINRAALCISLGRDIFEEICWECQTIKAEVFKCGGCRVAQYCCKEHQRQAWSGGHRNSCGLVNDVRKFMELNLKRIEKAVKADDILGGGERLMKPCLEIDYVILQGMVASYVSTRFKPMPFGPPSMDNYYRNLADVVDGEECFVFPDTPNVALRDSSNDGGISKDEHVMGGTLHGDDPFLNSILALSCSIGFRVDSNEEGENTEAKRKLTVDATSERILFRTAREFLDRYRSYHVEPGKSRWKERKTELLQFTRDYLIKFHQLQTKPPGHHTRIS